MHRERHQHRGAHQSPDVHPSGDANPVHPYRLDAGALDAWDAVRPVPCPDGCPAQILARTLVPNHPVAGVDAQKSDGRAAILRLHFLHFGAELQHWAAVPYRPGVALSAA